MVHGEELVLPLEELFQGHAQVVQLAASSVVGDEHGRRRLQRRARRRAEGGEKDVRLLGDKEDDLHELVEQVVLGQQLNGLLEGESLDRDLREDVQEVVQSEFVIGWRGEVDERLLLATPLLLIMPGTGVLLVERLELRQVHGGGHDRSDNGEEGVEEVEVVVLLAAQQVILLLQRQDLLGEAVVVRAVHQVVLLQ